MKYSMRLISGGICILFFLMSTGIFAQVIEETTRIDTNLVIIDVLVMDKTGHVVTGLRADQFELFDDNAKQVIESFSAEAEPVSFGIVFDMHPTTYERNRTVLESLKSFTNVLGQKDDLFLLAFNMQGQQIFDFVPTLEQLERHMADPAKREPRSLYDAVYFASDRIQSSRNQKRVLLIISDSADHNSRHTFSAVQRKLAAIRTEVYAVIVDSNNGLGYKDITHNGREVYPSSSDASELDRAALLDLTLKSGGSTYFGGTKSSLQLDNIYRDVDREMRSHYTLGFYPDVIDGKRHSIRVRLRGVPSSKGFVLVYRMGYRNPSKKQ